jgi:hypothetical protein
LIFGVYRVDAEQDHHALPLLLLVRR